MTTLTPDEVRDYAGIPASMTDETIQIYIDLANLIVTEDLAACEMSDERRDSIELNLAAHYATQGLNDAATVYGGLISQKVGSSEERYSSMSDKNFGLVMSRFGQIAITLDPCGILLSISSAKKKATFEVIVPTGFGVRCY